MFNEFLEKVIQFGWSGAPTIFSPFLLDELGIEWIINHGGSWMKIISKSLLVSKIVLVKILFFQTFYEKSLMFLIIILESYLQLSELNFSWFYGFLGTFLYAILYWTSFFRTDIDLSQLGDLLWNSDIWMSTDRVYLVLFWDKAGWF